MLSSDCGNKRTASQNNQRTFDNIWKIATGQGDDYTTRFLHYVCFKNYYQMITIDLSKQRVLYADPEVIQQINFTGNLDRAGYTGMYFIIE